MPRTRVGRARHGRRRSARAHAAARARARRAPTSRAAARSGSACPWASVARTPDTWPCAPGWSGRCPAVSSVCPRTPTGRSRLPARTADPRAAHPPGEGDEQHLYRAGPARGDRQHVRGLPRPAGSHPDRPADARARRDAGRRSPGGRRRARARRVLRHRHRDRARAGRRRSGAAAEAVRHQPAHARRGPGVGVV